MDGEALSENLEELEYDGEITDEDHLEDHLDEEEEAAAEEDAFSRLGDSEDDPERKQRYLEYLELIKEISCQNKTIEDLKTQIQTLCQKPCKTRCEMKNIQCMRQCMEQENLKLQCLTSKAMRLQNFGSKRRYQDVLMATTFDEDNMSPYIGCISQVGLRDSSTGDDDSSTPDSGSSQPRSQPPCPSPCPPPCPPPRSTPSPCPSRSSPPRPDTLKKLCKALSEIKVSCPKDKQFICDVLDLLQSAKRKTHRRPSVCRTHGPQPPYQVREDPCSDGFDKVKKKICTMQEKIDSLKSAICARERKSSQNLKDSVCPCTEEEDPIITCGGKSKDEQLKKLTDQYVILMSEFAKKDCQLKELNQRMKGLTGGACGDDNEKSKADKAEIQLLRTYVNEMKEGQAELKCIMKEQGSQLEEYRDKYLVAQQKVEEQSVAIEKLSMNNRRIEKQINTEVKEIRMKFQAKINELLHYPKLLENEQLKLAQTSNEKDDLQGKLVLVCRELKATKAKLEQPTDADVCRQQLVKTQIELAEVKTKMDEYLKQRDLFCEKLKTTQDDLDTMRSESAKIIARTKERSEATRQAQKEEIDRLEKQLAQCRATACLSVNDREGVIREMQGQLNTLSYSFDSAQKQITTLKNHIAYVSNDNCFPIQC